VFTDTRFWIGVAVGVVGVMFVVPWVRGSGLLGSRRGDGS
jgi:hypothetical protein